MPALRLYGRTWRTSTDMVPAAAALGATFHLAWIIVFGVLFSIGSPWKVQCFSPGRNYVATGSSLISVYAALFLCECGMIFFGIRGPPLWVSKRRMVLPLLYIQTPLWICQTILVVYGTVTIARIQPDCWKGWLQRWVHAVTVATVATTWVYTAFLWGSIYAMYNMYQDTSTVAAWEECFSKTMGMLGMKRALTAEVEGRGSALPRLAQVLYELFGNVDLVLSDIMVAIVLTAASQQNRRRAYIETKFGTRFTEDEELDDSDVDEPETIVGSDYAPLSSSGNASGGASALAPGSANGSKAEALQPGAKPSEQPQRPGDLPAAKKAANALPSRWEEGAGARLDGIKVDSGHAPGSPQKTPRTPATPVPGPPPPWPPGAPYPIERQISVRFPTVITPSEMAEHVKGDADPVKAADQYIGARDRVDYATLKDAGHYAKFATAVYGINALTDDEPKPGLCSCGAAVAGTRGTCGRLLPACAPPPPVTHSTIQAAILEVLGMEVRDLVYFSSSNDVMTDLPYMICLDRKRREVVLAIRGTVSLADAITDIVVAPEAVDNWIPAAEREKLIARSNEGCFAHKGIVQATEAVLSNIDRVGLLDYLLDSRPGPLRVFLASLTEAQRDSVRRSSCGLLDDAQGRQIKDWDLPTTTGWRLVVTGHSLGAGCASLLAMKLRLRFPDLRCWAFSPPGCMINRTLVRYVKGFVTAVVAGKDIVPRMSVVTLNRLVDEMVTSLGRCRHNKIRVLSGGWWRKEARPPPAKLFYAYPDLPEESRAFLERYYNQEDIKDANLMGMYPPGKIIFMRPLKTVKGKRTVTHLHAPKQKCWDAVWISAYELIGEGILLSKAMLEDHLIQSTVLGSISYATLNHPANSETEEGRKAQAASDKRIDDLADSIVDAPAPQQFGRKGTHV